MAHQISTKPTFEYDERIRPDERRILESRSDAFAKAASSADCLYWTFIEDTRRRRYFQLRKNADRPQCFVELTLEEIQTLDDTDISRIIVHRERPCVDVEARLDRWVERLNELWQQIADWCQPLGDACKIQRAEGAQRDEAIMRGRGAAPRKVPTLTITYEDNITRIVPNALFVVGANGRVDILTQTKHYTLVDLAPDSAPKRDWKITDDSERILAPFSGPVLRGLVRGRG